MLSRNQRHSEVLQGGRGRSHEQQKEWGRQGSGTPSTTKVRSQEAHTFTDQLWLSRSSINGRLIKRGESRQWRPVRQQTVSTDTPEWTLLSTARVLAEHQRKNFTRLWNFDFNPLVKEKHDKKNGDGDSINSQEWPFNDRVWDNLSFKSKKWKVNESAKPFFSNYIVELFII